VARTLPIEMIIVDRELEPGDDVSTLAEDIAQSGLQVPILLDGDYVLIDGLRRLEAVRTLGQTEVEVVATSMFPVACEYLTRAREHGVGAKQLTTRRTWQIYQRMRVILQITKSHLITGRPKGATAKSSAGGRPMLAKALGYRSEAPLQAITHVYRYAEEKVASRRSERAREAVALLEEGSLSVYGAVDYIDRVDGLQGDITKYQEQKDAIEAAINALRGLMFGLFRLGPLDPKFPVEEAQKLSKDLVNLRGQFYRFVRTFNEEINKNVQ
jgi:ParB-like nuclease domain